MPYPNKPLLITADQGTAFARTEVIKEQNHYISILDFRGERNRVSNHLNYPPQVQPKANECDSRPWLATIFIVYDVRADNLVGPHTLAVNSTTKQTARGSFPRPNIKNRELQ
jgi:hypothetical protein